MLTCMVAAHQTGDGEASKNRLAKSGTWTKRKTWATEKETIKKPMVRANFDVVFV